MSNRKVRYTINMTMYVDVSEADALAEEWPVDMDGGMSQRKLNDLAAEIAGSRAGEEALHTAEYEMDDFEVFTTHP